MPRTTHLKQVVTIGGIFVAALTACTSETKTSAGPTPAGPIAPAASPAIVTSNPAGTVSIDNWTFEDQTGQAIQTRSFRIFTTVTRQGMLNRLPTFKEMALDHYTTTLGTLPRPTTPMESYIMANRPQWSRLTQRLMGEDAEIYLRIQRGGFTARGRSILYNIGEHDTFAIIAHEGWHEYSQTTFRHPLPVWMEEGLATYMEGFRWDPEYRERPIFMPWANIERFDALRAGERADRLIPLEKLLTQTPQELMEKNPDTALLYYAQTWALVHFLNEGETGKYRAGLQIMLADAAQGKLFQKIARTRGQRAAQVYAFQRRGPDVLAAYINSDLSALQAEYSNFILAVTKVGAKQNIVAGKSPLLLNTP